ncbi:uncharacterized protein LOC117791924 [Drosophila innubila]|uniref:uncharacterized protein LOC117791924 n=1 Tax=Drosophila innubila TaxID=198719 RepID=UPI00148B6F88|nr:uncharacterized protein LOC117791924 [Drosophila innubila]
MTGVYQQPQQSRQTCELNCKQIQAKATSLAASCCRLTRPSLDKGNAECREQLNLLKNRSFSFVEQYSINMCIEECNYISSGYIDIDPPFRLDMAIVKRNLDNTMPQPQTISVPFMLDAFAKCRAFRAQHAKLFAVHLPDIEFITDDCNSFALHVTICVRIHAMQKCPKEFYEHSNSNCQMAREYFTHCVEDIESNISN